MVGQVNCILVMARTLLPRAGAANGRRAIPGWPCGRSGRLGFSTMPGHDGNLGAKRAREARAALGLGPEDPFACVLTAIEEAGVPVVVAALPGKVAGCCLKAGDRSLLFVNGHEYVGRQRFTLAHEYGHHVLGHEGMPPDSTDTVVALFARSSIEVQANAFAAEFLAPAAGVATLRGAADVAVVVA